MTAWEELGEDSEWWNSNGYELLEGKKCDVNVR